MKSLLIINTIYSQLIEQRYAPGGKGMMEALNNFEKYKEIQS